MFWKKAKRKEEQVKALSEKEIQKQLYGQYLGKDEPRVEVMDSSAIGEQKDERPIEEKYSAKAKRQLKEEIEGLKTEFKHLRDEVNRLRKEREALERAEAGLKLPFLKTHHLVIIGSVVVLLVAIIASVLVVRFMFTKVAAKKPGVSEVTELPSKLYTVQVYTAIKKEDADNVSQLLYSKGFPARVREVKSSLGKSQYVVYVGEYSDKEEASQTAQKIRKEKEFKDSFVRTK
ncbi:MAG: hypothetical protein AMJ78_01215 [Omnitrophica WOR_2 bacterium SM23_29]|nr:MAG: hypothetical protein AMJ78_01215 [Omnitrophica WOR_2 bacterium SM23_29]